ncbi:MAG: TatD family hydrolase [Flavobacteriales bacterium]|nr:TatD family hydrolase [Flavobacteriales bacterium]
MVPLINIHTHRKPGNREWAIRYGWLHRLRHPISVQGYYISTGLHPWKAHTLSPIQLEDILQLLIKHQPLIAIGEIGLDRANGPEFTVQMKTLEVQLNIAENANKPVIIHCVKAYADLLPIIQTRKNIQFVLHDYAGNAIQTNQFLRQPNVSFSLGKILFRNVEKAQMLLDMIPENRMFLETDVMPISIETVFERAAELKGIEKELLASHVFENAKSIFDLSVGK